MEARKFSHDMTPEDFRTYGYKLVDWIADYLENIEKFPVTPQIKPGDIKKMLPASPPLSSQPMGEILKDIDNIIVPGLTHWNHPDFMAYFNSTSS